MKNLIVLIFLVLAKVGITQIKLNFEEPCKACGMEYLKNAPEKRPESVMLYSNDYLQQIGYSLELIEHLNPDGTLTYHVKKYIHCWVSTKEKPKSKRLYIQLSDNSKLSMTGVKIDFNPTTELYTISGKKVINSKDMVKRLKYNTVTHFGNYQETIPIDNTLAYLANNLFLCIFFR